MDIKVVISLCGLAMTVISFILGQKSGISKKGYEQGIKDANIKNSIDNLANKIEEYAAKSATREEFVRVEEKIKSLNKRTEKIESMLNMKGGD